MLALKRLEVLVLVLEVVCRNLVGGQELVLVGQVTLGGVEDTDATGANGDTDAEEEVKELCRPWKFAKATDVHEPALAFVVTSDGEVCVTR